jgi:hypothetical protein
MRSQVIRHSRALAGAPAARVGLAAGTLAAGFITGWLVSGRAMAIALLATAVAAANGYAKAYSP